MTNEQLWTAALGQFELSMSQGNFRTWFKETKITDRTEGVVTVETPSAFNYEWLSKKYRSVILEVLKNLDVTINGIEFTIRSRVAQQRYIKKNFYISARKTSPQTVSVIQPTPTPITSSVKVDQRARMLARTLNQRYTFESFVVGSSNEIAYAACQAVAEQPGVAYNPLFLYGGVGLGKTHLLQAVGNAIIAASPGARVLYVSSEKFINEFVVAIREQTIQRFKDYFRDVDVLIIDDVQFLAGKSKTQEELFHTFNALHGQNRQVILSSDRSPKALPTFEERLRSRLEGGMTADIKPPDYETRLAILSEKCRQRNILIDDDALAYIAKNIQKNVRELEGGLNRVVAYCELIGNRATLEIAKKVLEDAFERPPRKTVDTHHILEIVSAYYNLSLDELCGKCRKKEIVRPRQIAMYLLRRENNASFPMIGESFGGRDHTTAMHACGKILKLLEHDEELVQEINFLRERLYA